MEKALLRGGVVRLAAMDEVGRGALAGPVSVGVVVVTERIGRVPAGLKDSKLLTPEARRALVSPIRRWVGEYAVGHATAVEIDAWGIVPALRAAARRALAQLSAPVDAVLLDGSFDYLTERPVVEADGPTLFDADVLSGPIEPVGLLSPGAADAPEFDDADDLDECDGTEADLVAEDTGDAGDAEDAQDVEDSEDSEPAEDAEDADLADAVGPDTGEATAGEPSGPVLAPAAAAARRAAAALVGAFPPAPAGTLPVHVRVKGDLFCAGVAGASVLAKTERDAMLVALHDDHPEYGFGENKGYGTPEHKAALRTHGPSAQHRRTWRLPTRGDVFDEPVLSGLDDPARSHPGPPASSGVAARPDLPRGSRAPSGSSDRRPPLEASG